jgi:DNA adenine methylase
MIETIDIELKPFIKWPGGKTKELKVIIPNLPKRIDDYYEPFIGGGAVYFSIKNAKQYFINDKSKDLVDLYLNIKSSNNKKLFQSLLNIDNYWKHLDNIYIRNRKIFFETFLSLRGLKNFNLKNEIEDIVKKLENEFTHPITSSFDYDFKFYLKEINVNLYRKMSRMRKIESEKGLLSNEDIDLNILTALKSSFYMYFRQLYNKPKKYKLDNLIYSSIYFFIRNYTYSGMFRYNSKGEFNVPYGGIGYNNNSLDKKIKYISSQEIQERLKITDIECNDFFDFFKDKKVQKNDFIFLDPPYDTEFSTYDQNEFNSTDQKRLAHFLLNDTRCKWMLVIKNTPFIKDLYLNKLNINIKYFDKSYNVSFMNRNDKETEHLLITNY